MIRNHPSNFLVNYASLGIFFSIVLVCFTIFFSPDLNYYTIFLIFFFLFLHQLKCILKFSNFLFNFFLFSLLVKLLLLNFLYTAGYNLGFQYGDIGGSDGVTYFTNSKIFLDILKYPDIFTTDWSHLIKLNVLKDFSFFSYNASLIHIIPKISLEQICSFNILLNSFSSLIFFKILNFLKLNKKIVLTAVIISLIDLKLIFYGFFNLKETMINFFLLFIIFNVIYYKSSYDFLKKFYLISIICLSLIIISFLRNHITVILLILIFINIVINTIKPKINLKIIIFYNLIIISIIFFLFCYLFGDNYIFLKEYLFPFKNENSIGSSIINLNIIYQPFNLIIQLLSGIIGIFPLYKFYTYFIELEKFALIFSHILFILSFFGFYQIIEKNLLDKKTLLISTFIVLILFFSTLGSFGSLSFIRYSIHAEYVLIYFASFYIFEKKIIRLKKVIFLYLLIQIILIIIHFVTKNYFF